MSRSPARALGPDGRLRLERAVLEAERDTSAELAVWVTHACDPDRAAAWRLAVALAALSALLQGLWLPGSPAWSVVAAQGGALILAHGLARLDSVRRALVRDAALERRSFERARRAFAETGLARAPGRRGLLIFVALFERRVWVLADEGIRAALGNDETLRPVLEAALEGLRRGHAVEALEAAVRSAGAVLGRHLPGAPRELETLPAPLLLEEPDA